MGLEEWVGFAQMPAWKGIAHSQCMVTQGKGIHRMPRIFKQVA